MKRQVDAIPHVKRVRRPMTYEPRAVGSCMPDMEAMLRKYGRWGRGKCRRSQVGTVYARIDLTPRLVD